MDFNLIFSLYFHLLLIFWNSCNKLPVASCWPFLQAYTWFLSLQNIYYYNDSHGSVKLDLNLAILLHTVYVYSAPSPISPTVCHTSSTFCQVPNSPSPNPALLCPPLPGRWVYPHLSSSYWWTGTVGFPGSKSRPALGMRDNAPFNKRVHSTVESWELFNPLLAWPCPNKTHT